MADQLARLAQLGYDTPSHIYADIRNARRDIKSIQRRLAQLGYPVEHHPDDDDADHDQRLPIDDPSSGVDLFTANPRFSRFYRTPQLESVITQIGQVPTYHVIEGAMGYGKTALLGELWRSRSGESRIVLAYLFSRNHGRTRVAQAVRSLYQQIRTVTTLSEGLPEENTALTPTVLRMIAGYTTALTLLIDGLDECDEAERSQFTQLIPDVNLAGVTIVLTIRPTVNELLLRHLPTSHLLQELRVATEGAGARLHRIDTLTTNEIRGLLQLLGHGNNPELAAQIFAYSGGVPMAAIDYVQQPQLLNTAQAQPVVAYHERVLRCLQEQCPPEQHTTLDQLLAMLAAAQSPLSLFDLETLLGVPRAQLLGLRDLLARYRQMASASEIALDHRLREYLQVNEHTCAAVRQANDQLMEWTLNHIRATDLSGAPLYALLHGAEYLAKGHHLVTLLCRAEWLTTLERRYRARSECIAAVERAMSSAMDAFCDNGDEISIVNIILGAIIRSSLGATLAPELVAQLVRYALWSEQEAHEYAQNYASLANRQVLDVLLSDPTCPISFPTGSAVAETAANLSMLAKLRPVHRVAALRQWQRGAEQMGDSAHPSSSAELLHNLVSALRQPAQQGGGHVSTYTFEQLTASLQSYTPPLTGAMNDPYFVDIITDIADTWWQLPDRQLARFWIDQIISVLARYTRSDLLEALELLAPALRTLFPGSIVDLIAALKQLEMSDFISA
ncbi:MAG: NACHT domain-containing protein [Oscillochloris sp.]|nr:NACHT domain-containing protein [Oscillochloris sp.]